MLNTSFQGCLQLEDTLAGWGLLYKGLSSMDFQQLVTWSEQCKAPQHGCGCPHVKPSIRTGPRSPWPQLPQTTCSLPKPSSIPSARSLTRN